MVRSYCDRMYGAYWNQASRWCILLIAYWEKKNENWVWESSVYHWKCVANRFARHEKIKFLENITKVMKLVMITGIWNILNNWEWADANSDMVTVFIHFQWMIIISSWSYFWSIFPKLIVPTCFLRIPVKCLKLYYAPYMHYL